MGRAADHIVEVSPEVSPGQSVVDRMLGQTPGHPQTGQTAAGQTAAAHTAMDRTPVDHTSAEHTSAEHTSAEHTSAEHTAGRTAAEQALPGGPETPTAPEPRGSTAPPAPAPHAAHTADAAPTPAVPAPHGVDPGAAERPVAPAPPTEPGGPGGTAASELPVAGMPAEQQPERDAPAPGAPPRSAAAPVEGTPEAAPDAGLPVTGGPGTAGHPDPVGIPATAAGPGGVDARPGTEGVQPDTVEARPGTGNPAHGMDDVAADDVAVGDVHPGVEDVAGNAEPGTDVTGNVGPDAGSAEPGDEGAGPGSGSVPEAAEPVAVADDEHPHVSYVLHVNGVDRPVTSAWIGESLLYVLRERLGLAGAKDGCAQGECGACSVQVDGRLVAACLVPAATAAGSEVRTVEGLARNGAPSDVQCALAESGSVQCGFCVPGLAMTVHDLLEGNHAPSDLETRKAISGNLCRCSGYRGVLDAVRTVVSERAAKAERDAAEAEAHSTGQPGRPGQNRQVGRGAAHEGHPGDPGHPGDGGHPAHGAQGEGGYGGHIPQQARQPEWGA